MQVSVEDLSSVKKVMHIEVPSEDVARELDEAYKELKKTAKIKGFRPGKVPRSVLERHYKKSVNADVSQKLLQQSLVDAFQETKLQPLGMPVIDPPEIDGNSPFKYDATIEVPPELEDLDYKGLELVRTKWKVTEKEVDGQIRAVQKTMSVKVKIDEDRPVQDSDYVVIDYEAFRDAKPVAEIPKTESYTLKIGAGTIHEDLDQGLIGMKVGDSKRISVTFPETMDEKIAGSPIDFEVSLKEIRKEQLEEIDDEFAKKLGPFESLEQLKGNIRENMKEAYDKRIEQELNEQIFQALLKRQSFEVPDHMVNLELDQIVSDIEKNVENHGKTLEEVGMTKERLAEEHRDTAVRQVKRHLLLDKLIKQEKLELTDEELETGYGEMAKTFQQPPQILKKHYEMNPEQLDFFKHALLEKKAIKLIIDTSSITEKEPDEDSENKVDES